MDRDRWKKLIKIGRWSGWWVVSVSSGTGSPGLSRTKGRKTVVVVVCVIFACEIPTLLKSILCHAIIVLHTNQCMQQELPIMLQWHNLNRSWNVHWKLNFPVFFKSFIK